MFIFQTVASRSIQSLIAHITIAAQGFIIAPILIKITGPNLLGDYSIIMLLLVLIFSFSSLGVGTFYKR